MRPKMALTLVVVFERSRRGNRGFDHLRQALRPLRALDQLADVASPPSTDLRMPFIDSTLPSGRIAAGRQPENRGLFEIANDFFDLAR